MKIELTLQQLKRILGFAVQRQNPKHLIYLLEKKKGTDDFHENYQDLVDYGLVKKVGGRVYLVFSVDGEKPLKTTPQVAKRRGVVDSMGSFSTMWLNLGGDPIIASEYNLLQKLVNTMTMPQFISAIEKFFASFQGFKSIRNFWNNREYFS